MTTRILGFGASTMRGAGDATGGGFFNRLQTLVRAEQPIEWTNLGIGGHTTRDMVARTDRAIAARATHVVVILGCNDLPRKPDQWPGHRATIGEYRANVQRLLTTIRAPWSLFVTSFPVCAQRTGIARGHFDEYMAVAASLAVDVGYDLWDLQTEIAPTVERYWVADGLHFNDAGHAVIAQGVADRLNRQLDRP